MNGRGKHGLCRLRGGAKSPGMIVDAHVHLYPPEIAAAPAAWAERAGERHWAELCTRRRRDGRPVQEFPTVDGLLRAMDAAGIGRAWLLGWYWERAETAAWQNRFYAACVRAHPDRLAAFGAVQPAAGPDAATAEIRRMREEGLIGIGELSPHTQEGGIGGEGLAATLTLAGELGLPVNLHVTDPAGRAYPGRVETPPADFAVLAERYPETQFVLAHWGGRIGAWRPEVARRDNVWFDTAASPLLYADAAWPELLRECGAGDRVLFGSDYPLVLYPKLETAAELGRLVAAAKAGGASDAVLGGNAVRLLRGGRAG